MSRPSSPAVAVITSEVGWHSVRMAEAFKKYGCKVSFSSLPEYEFATCGPQTAFARPDFSNGLPDIAFVRCIPKGSFEQVTFYLDVLHALEEQGVAVFNRARAIERSVDKTMTGFLLQQAGLPTPLAWAGTDQSRAEAFINDCLAHQRELVMKPVFGSQGGGLQRISREHPEPFFPENSVYYLQEYIDSRDDDGNWHDWRLFVIFDRVAASMKRVNSHWINNVAQGGKCHAAQADAEMTALAEAASAAVGTAFAGVDMIRNRQGRCWITEVNSIPSWRGLQGVVQMDIAVTLAEEILQHT